MCRRPEEVKAAQHSYGDDRLFFQAEKNIYIYISEGLAELQGGKKAERVNLKINAEDAGHLRQQR